MRSQRAALMYSYQPRALPKGPPSDVLSTAEPPSTIGLSASMVTPTPARGRHDFSISYYETKTNGEDLQHTVGQTPTTQQDDGRDARTPLRTKTLMMTSPMKTTPSPRQPDMTTDRPDVTPEQDIYYGVYPDFQLPLPNKPCISDLFV